MSIPLFSLLMETPVHCRMNPSDRSCERPRTALCGNAHSWESGLPGGANIAWSQMCAPARYFRVSFCFLLPRRVQESVAIQCSMSYDVHGEDSAKILHVHRSIYQHPIPRGSGTEHSDRATDGSLQQARYPLIHVGNVPEEAAATAGRSLAKLWRNLCFTRLLRPCETSRFQGPYLHKRTATQVAEVTGPHSGRRGRGFKSRHPDRCNTRSGPVLRNQHRA